MVRQERFIRKLEELGCVRVSSGKGQMMFRKPGTMHFIPVKEQDLLPCDYVRHALNQLGEDIDCIESFIANN